jgi:hypothetical protein
VWGELAGKVKSLGKILGNLSDLMESEAKLQAQLLDPLEEIRATYRIRYLQAYDSVTGECEAVRHAIARLGHSPEIKTLEALATIDALGQIDLGGLEENVAACKGRLFQTDVDRNGVERALRDRPDPEGCPLQVDQAGDLIREAKEAGELAQSLGPAELSEVAVRLRQPALWSLLEQGRDEPFLAELLATANERALGTLLADRLPDHPERVSLLKKYLKRIVVKTIRLQDFQPSQTLVEPGEIERVVGEFRRFLEAAVKGEGAGYATILEIR